MNKLLIFSLILFCFPTCAVPEHPDASRLCDCFRRAHVYGLDTIKSKEFADSCLKIHLDIYEKYEKDKNGFDAFNAAFNECR